MSNANWNGMPSHPQSSSNYGNQFNSIQPSTLAAPMRYDFNSGFHPTNSNFNNPSNLNQSQQQQFNPTAPSSSSAHSNYDSIPSGPSRGNGRGRGRGRGASGNRGGPRGTASFQSCDTSDRAESIDYSRGNSRGRGRGRGRGSRGGPSFNSSSRDSASTSLPRGVTDGNSGPLSCDFDQCTYKTDQSLALILHKADRHLIFPQGGEEELKRLDPMLIEEEKERRKKEKKRKGRDDDDEEEDESALSLIPGLNISLSTPALIEYWREERRKRWPRASVLEKKLQEEADAKARGEVRSSNHRDRAAGGQGDNSKEQIGKRKRDLEDEGSNSESDSASEDDEDLDSDEAEARGEAEADPDGLLDDSDSDMDPVLDAVSSKIPLPEDGAPLTASSKELPTSRPTSNAKQDKRPLCSFFLKGSCSFGETCRKRHERPDSKGNSTSNSTSLIKNRPHPRPQPRNPFEAPQLELALLRAEISQHVSAVSQCVRFLVQNRWLEGVALEIEPGEDNQSGDVEKKEDGKGSLIQVISETPAESGNAEQDETAEEPIISAPIVPGGSSSVPSTEVPGARSLITTEAKPEGKKKISSLIFPPEPSALIYLDPLRRDEPKPLRRIQLEALATDPSMRRLLSGHGISSELNDPLMTSISLKRALRGLDSLPTDDHRISALELILGVSTQSSTNAHNDNNNSSYSNHLKQKNQIPEIGTSSSGGTGRKKKVITEKEILSLGLRIGPDEAKAIRSLAARVSEVALVPFMGNPEDATTNLGLGHLGQALALAGGAPEFDAQGWGAVMREREMEEERLSTWKQLGLRMD